MNILPVLFAKVKPSVSEVGAENESYYQVFLFDDK